MSAALKPGPAILEATTLTSDEISRGACYADAAACSQTEQHDPHRWTTTGRTMHLCPGRRL